MTTTRLTLKLTDHDPILIGDDIVIRRAEKDRFGNVNRLSIEAPSDVAIDRASVRRSKIATGQYPAKRETTSA